MITYNMQKSEICWHGLLNRSEARVLSPVEERKLLVELVDCKNRILECLAQTDDAIWHESVPQTDFQQLVRDLAGPDNSRLDPPTEGLRSLARRYQEIRAKLAMANVRLVAHVAKRYHDRGIPPGDLIQEGFCALLVAIDRFDVVNETRLATYAIWWIRQAIQRAVAGGAYPVRLNPRQLQELARRKPFSGPVATSGNERRVPIRRRGPSHRRSSRYSRPLARFFRSTRPAGSTSPRPSANYSFQRRRIIHLPMMLSFRWKTW